MDVVGAESSSPFSTTIEISAQRKSRQLLIHIETLYRILLKLEDLENPIAIATSLIVKVTVTRTNFIEKLRLGRRASETLVKNEKREGPDRHTLTYHLFVTRIAKFDRGKFH